MKDLFRPFIGFREIKVVHKGPRHVSVVIMLVLLITSEIWPTNLEGKFC